MVRLGVKDWAGMGAALAALAAAGPAHAGVAEARFGVMAHNICATYCDNSNKEDGPAVELQLSFDTPGLLAWAGAPQPYAIASVNLSGDTSFAGVGLEWRWDLSQNWSIEPGVGYVAHDGATNLPFASGSPQAAAFTEENVLLGSRDLFRLSLGVTRELAGPWQAQLFFSHLSHGQILGKGRNQGMDQVGIRFGYRFGD